MALKNILWVPAALIILAWTSVMLPGFAFPWNTNIYHIPIVLNYSGSLEGPHDAFTQSLSNFVSGFWIFISIFSTESNISSVFFLFHFIGRILFIYGFYAIIRHYGTDKIWALALTGIASVAPIFKRLSLIGHTETLASFLTHTVFCIAVLPLCWLLLIRGRWIAGAAAIGFLFNINAFISIWSALAAFIALWSVRDTIPKFERKLIACGLCYTLFSSPTLAWTLSTVLGQKNVQFDFRSYLLYYYPFHTFLNVQWNEFIRYTTFCLSAALVVYTAMKDLGSKGKVLVSLIIGYGFVFFLGTVLPYFTGSSLLLNLYPLRMDAALNVSFAALMLSWAGHRLSNGSNSLPIAIALALLSNNCIATLWLLHLEAKNSNNSKIPLCLLVLSSLILFAAQLPPGFGNEFLPLYLAFSVLALCAVAQSNPKAILPTAATFCLTLLPYDQKWSVAVTVTILIGSIFLYLPFIRRISNFAINPKAILYGFFITGLTIGIYAAKRQTLDRFDKDIASEREAQVWLRTHTAPGTVFLPVYVSGFSTLSRRSAWVDRPMGAAVMWKPEYYLEWWPRIHEFNACNTSPCFVALARRHNIEWIVAEPGKFSFSDGLSQKFSNKIYQIWHVEPVQKSGNKM